MCGPYDQSKNGDALLVVNASKDPVMDIDVQNADASQSHVLDTVEGEIHFFRSLMRARPVGMHRYFHVIAMQSAIEKGTKTLVSIDDIWRKLESCYNLEALEALVRKYHSMLFSLIS